MEELVGADVEVVLLGRPGPVGRESELDGVLGTLLAEVVGFLLGVLEVRGGVVVCR